MNYYLGLIRFKMKIEYDNGLEETIDSEMTQLVRAITKEDAQNALVKYFEKEYNGVTLIEVRINDTITHNGETEALNKHGISGKQPDYQTIRAAAFKHSNDTCTAPECDSIMKRYCMDDFKAGAQWALSQVAGVPTRSDTMNKQ